MSYLENKSIVNKKFISILLFFSFFISIFLVDNVNSAIGIYTIDFEDGTVSQQYENSIMNTTKTGNTFEVSNTNNYEGTRSFRLLQSSGTSIGYWTYKYYITAPITNFSTYIKEVSGSSDTFTIYFNNSIGENLIKFLVADGTTSEISYYDYTNTVHSLGSVPTSYYAKLSFDIILNDTIRYNYNGTTIIDTGRNIKDDFSIKTITFQGTTGNTYEYHFDNIVFTSGYISGNASTDYTVSGYGKYENKECGVLGGITIYRFSSNNFGVACDNINGYYADTIEMLYYENVDIHIYYVDLYVTENQLALISDSYNDYECYVNGIYLGNAVAFIERSISYTSGYLIRFFISGGVDINNEPVLISFRCNKHYNFGTNYGEVFWYPFVLSGQCNWDSRKYYSYDNDIQISNNELDGVYLNNKFCVPIGGLEYPFGIEQHVSPYINYYYTLDSTQENATSNTVSDDVLNDLKDKFGNFFIQFKDYDEECKYRVGSNPSFVYYLDESRHGNVSGYIWEMYHNVNDLVSSGSIYFTGLNESKYLTINNFVFTETGEYYIRLYNISSEYTKMNSVYRSLNIQVCDSIPDNEPVSTFDFSKLPILYRLICTLFIVILATLTPIIINLFISKKTGKVLELPDILYVAFFFFGFIFSIAIGLADVLWLIIILIGLALFFAITWLRKNNNGE